MRRLGGVTGDVFGALDRDHHGRLTLVGLALVTLRGAQPG